MQELPVRLGERTYPIFIGTGILDEAGFLIRKIIKNNRLLLVSNSMVFDLYGQELVDSLQKEGFELQVALMPDGEQYKNMDEAMKILDQAVDMRLERSSGIVALGGGVVGDLAGFVAAVYQRGVDFIQIPTTLLAQVDSSVGGKVAVNHPRGKNLIGAFHQPRMVIIDSSTLDTLAEREYLSGLGEVVKYGIIYDREFFYFMEENAAMIINRDDACIEKLIFQSCKIKSKIVAEDEKELGIRVILNLGHSFGHSIEKLGNFREHRHGEAVAMGTMAAAYLALDMELIEPSELMKIYGLYKTLGLSVKFPPYDPNEVYTGMLNDKKVADQKLRLVLPKGIGDYAIIDAPAREDIILAIKRAQKSKYLHIL